MGENINKQPPKGKVRFSITLSEEQKDDQRQTSYTIHTILLWVNGSGKPYYRTDNY